MILENGPSYEETCLYEEVVGAFFQNAQIVGVVSCVESIECYIPATLVLAGRPADSESTPIYPTINLFQEVWTQDQDIRSVNIGMEYSATMNGVRERYLITIEPGGCAYLPSKTERMSDESIQFLRSLVARTTWEEAATREITEACLGLFRSKFCQLYGRNPRSGLPRSNG